MSILKYGASHKDEIQDARREICQTIRKTGLNIFFEIANNIMEDEKHPLHKEIKNIILYRDNEDEEQYREEIREDVRVVHAINFIFDKKRGLHKNKNPKEISHSKRYNEDSIFAVLAFYNLG